MNNPYGIIFNAIRTSGSHLKYAIAYAYAIATKGVWKMESKEALALLSGVKVTDTTPDGSKGVFERLFRYKECSAICEAMAELYPDHTFTCKWSGFSPYGSSQDFYKVKYHDVFKVAVHERKGCFAKKR